MLKIYQKLVEGNLQWCQLRTPKKFIILYPDSASLLRVAVRERADVAHEVHRHHAQKNSQIFAGSSPQMTTVKVVLVSLATMT